MSKRWVHRIILLIAVGLAVAGYNACTNAKFTEVNGTSTMGNPFTVTHSSRDLLMALCGVIARCNSGVSVTSCSAQVLGVSGFAVPLGLPSDAFSSYGSISQAESDGVLVGNSAATDTCLAAVNNLQCTSPEVTGAYDPASANPYSGTPSMVSQSSCGNVFNTRIQSWKFVDGGGTTGLNLNVAGDAHGPSPAVLNGKLYAAWYEPSTAGNTRVHVKVYNSNDTSPVWSQVSPSMGLNVDPLKDAGAPHTVVLAQKLYVVWREIGSDGLNKIHASVYGGNDTAPSWTRIDGGTATGLNFSSSADGSWPVAEVFQGKLYVAWQEGPAASGALKIMMAVYGGDDANPTWTYISGPSGLSVAGGWTTIPRFVVFNTKLYATWTETASGSGIRQVRVLVYNGSDSSPQWTPVDGGGTAGLNKDATHVASTSTLGGFNGVLYVAFQESDSSGVTQLRVKSYNGNDSTPIWTFMDGGGATGINFDKTQGAYQPDFESFNGHFYVSWAEGTNPPKHMHVAAFEMNGTVPAWAFTDGGTVSGLNLSPAGDAYWGRWAIFSGKPYLLWFENNGTAFQIRAAVGQ